MIVFSLLLLAYATLFLALFEQASGPLLVIPYFTNNIILMVFPYILSFGLTLLSALIVEQKMRKKKMKNNYALNLTKLIIILATILVASFIPKVAGFVFPAVIVYVLLLVSFGIVALIKTIISE